MGRLGTSMAILALSALCTVCLSGEGEPGVLKLVRFRLRNSMWADGNTNTGLIIHDGQFMIGRAE